MSAACSFKNGVITLIQEKPAAFRKSISLCDIMPSHLDLILESESKCAPASPISEASTKMSSISRNTFESEDSRSSMVSKSSMASRSSTVSEKPEAPWRKLNEFVSENQVDRSNYTTVMVRNIPGLFTAESLVEEVRQTGNECNFVHLPLTKKMDINLGYAFVNFLTPEMARDFLQVFEGHQWLKHESFKVADVDYASMQGFDANVEFYSKRRIAGTKRAPWVLRQ
jgi:RNA recognition motif-containing protein